MSNGNRELRDGLDRVDQQSTMHPHEHGVPIAPFQAVPCATSRLRMVDRDSIARTFECTRSPPIAPAVPTPKPSRRDFGVSLRGAQFC